MLPEWRCKPKLGFMLTIYVGARLAGRHFGLLMARRAPRRKMGLYRHRAWTGFRGQLMSTNPKTISRDWLDRPSFEPRHRALGEALDRFVLSGAIDAIDHADVDDACRKLVRALGTAKLLDCAVAAPDGDLTTIDSRSICLSRESLAYAGRAGGLCLRDAGFGIRRDRPCGFAGAAKRRAAEGALRRMARSFRAVGKGGGLRCRRHELCCAGGWRQLAYRIANVWFIGWGWSREDASCCDRPIAR
jgi:hypothetical protein